MSDQDELLARALDDAVPQPPRDLDPESIRTEAPRRRRRSLGPSLAAAAVVVIAVGVGLVSHHGSAPGGAPKNGPHRDAVPTGQTSPTSSAEKRRQVAADRVTQTTTAEVVARLLAAAPVMPGATRVGHSPVKALDKPMEVPGTSNLVRRTRWWTAPGTMAGAIAYFSAHPPAGTKSSGSGSAGGPSGTTEQEVSFDANAAPWRRPTVYADLELLVAVAPAPGGVAIRVDAEAVWLPQRIPAEQIPDDVTSVDVVVDRKESAPTVRRTLAATDARSLAAVVNRLGVYPPYMYHCPDDRGFTDALTFHRTGADIVVEVRVSGCALVTVGPPSDHNPALGDAYSLDHAVLHALGLPRNYGQ